jgi:hypothetical protein
MPAHFVTVHRTFDAVEAEIVRDLLVEDGVSARLLGGAARPAELFGPATAVESRVDVPAEEAGRAGPLVVMHLEALREAQPEPEPADDSPAPASRPLSPLLAAGVVGIWPGGGHLYARRPLVALAILAGQVAALATLIGGPGHGRAASAAAVVVVTLLVVDLVGGQLAVRAHNRGLRLSRPRQALSGALILAGAGALAATLAPLLERLPGRRSHTRHGPHQILRRAPDDPRNLPFPLFLDFRR